MSTIELGGILAIVMILGWGAVYGLVRWFESRQPLTPNCLLTRRSIVLIGEKSHPMAFWNSHRRIHRHLKRHGYDIHLYYSTELHQLPDRDLHFIYLSSNAKSLGLLQSLKILAEQDFV